MGHYKSNLRDLEFNLFEVFGADQDLLRRGPFADWTSTPPASILDEMERLADERSGRVLRRRRPQPAGLRPGDRLRDDARVASRSATRPSWTASGGAWTCRTSSAASSRRASLVWAVAEMILGANPAICMYSAARHFAGVASTESAPRSRRRSPSHGRPPVGRHHGADRAGRRLRRRRRPHQGDRAGRTAPGTSRASSASSPAASTTCPRTSSTWCWRAPRAPGRAPRACRCSSCPKFHVRLGDRRARRAQRRLRHQRRAQDGPEGLDHLRGDLRRPSIPAVGCLVGERARRHRARCSRSSSTPG